MSFSIQTNIASLNAQDNLAVNQQFQNQTIQQLTSGYRINNSGDDAAGLAVANGYRSQIAELSQGVRNANDGISQLQIIDGGLSNISQTLDRLKTLATESASSTFSGNRATLNNEYQSLLNEVTRQASNIGLNQGGGYNTQLNIYTGGAKTAANAQVTIDLSGSNNAVDSTALGIGTSNVLGGGVGISGNTNRLDAPGGTYLLGTAGSDDQAFTFNIYNNGQSQTVTANIAASVAGTSSSAILGTLNTALNSYGVSASLDNNGVLQFSGATAFTASVTASAAGTSTVTTAAGTLTNTSNTTVAGAAAFATPTGPDVLKFQTTAGQATVNLIAGDSLSGAISKINSQTSSLGVYAVVNAAGTGISLQGSSSFTVQEAGGGTKVLGAASTIQSTAAVAGASTNATSAIALINTAVQNLGVVQGRVGTGENRLQYAIQLATSQISNFSAAQSRIRDADIAAEAANLTKAQVLQQASIAAAAQANSAPQAVLKLLGA